MGSSIVATALAVCPASAAHAGDRRRSTIVNRTVTPRRPRNADLREREYLTGKEVDRLQDAASELVALRWDDIDFSTSKLHVRRAKGGTASVHPLRAKELRALRRLLRETPEGQRATYLFVSERMAPLSVAGYQRMVARAGRVAGFGFLVHSHMLRHSTGYKLANDGHDTRAIQDYLGHRSIASTVRYTALAPDRFKHFWRD
jgi:integrase